MDLVEKSLSYIQAAVGDVEAGAPRTTFRHLIDAVTCLLKARLRKEHWVLVFQRPAEADLARFESGDFKAVDLGEIKERIRGYLQIGLVTVRATLNNVQRPV